MQNRTGYEIKIREEEGKREILDSIRKKWVALTPEEYVRQLFIRYLTAEKKYPPEYISVEHSFSFANGKPQRADIVIFGKKGKPLMIVECKAHGVIIDTETFRQATRYNNILQAPYIALSNGQKHYCLYTRDFIRYHHLKEFPNFPEIENKAL